MGQYFGVERACAARFDLSKVMPALEKVNKRLSRVIIENLNYTQFIRRYDTDKTLFYIDPPYFGVEHYYGDAMFHRDDFKRLADLLGRIKARFILSINDVPEIRSIFKQFNQEGVDTKYSVSHINAKELIITNLRP